MNNQEKLEYYVENFKKDPLYRSIQSNDESWLNELFTDPIYFDKVTFENTYSTKQAADLLGIPGKEQTLLNYINRNDCSWYLDVSRQTRFYRFDWKSLFKFKMILLLNDKGFTPMNIAGEIGTKLVVSSNSVEETRPRIANEVNKNLERVTIETANKLLESLQSIEEHRDQKAKLQLDNIEIEQTLIRAEEQIETLDARIEDMTDYMDLIKTTHQHNPNENKSVLSKLFGKANNKEQQNLEFNKQLEKMLNKIEQIKIEKESVSKKALEKRMEKEEVKNLLGALEGNPTEYIELLKEFKKELTYSEMELNKNG